MMESGAKHIKDRAAQVRAAWSRACAHDGVDPRGKYLQFTPTNPHVPTLNAAIAAYQEAVVNVATGGLAGT